MYWCDGWYTGLCDKTEAWFKTKPDQCVVFLAKTLHSDSSSLYPGVQIGTSKFSGKPDEMLGVNFAMNLHPIQERVVILSVTSC